jgi:hypothetical protein
MFVFYLVLNEHSLYDFDRLMYDLTYMQKAWDVPSDTQYTTSSNVHNGNFECSLRG